MLLQHQEPSRSYEWNWNNWNNQIRSQVFCDNPVVYLVCLFRYRWCALLCLPQKRVEPSSKQHHYHYGQLATLDPWFNNYVHHWILIILLCLLFCCLLWLKTLLLCFLVDALEIRVLAFWCAPCHRARCRAGRQDVNSPATIQCQKWLEWVAGWLLPTPFARWLWINLLLAFGFRAPNCAGAADWHCIR